MPQHTEREVARQKLLKAKVDPLEIEGYLDRRFGGRQIDPFRGGRIISQIRSGEGRLPGGPETRRGGRDIPRPPRTGKDRLLGALPAIGATALTLAAPQVGIPARIGLAILGGAGGEGFKQVAEGRTGADASIPQNILDIIKSGAEEGAYELGGEAVFRVGAKVLGPVRRQAGKAFRKIKKAPELESGAAKAIKVIQERTPAPPKSKLGTLLGTDQSKQVLLPGQATTSWVTDLAENAAEYGMGGGRIRAFKRAQQEAGPTVLDDFVSGIRRSGLGWAEVGDIAIDTLKRKHSVFIGSFKGRYKALEKISEGATVPFDPILDFLGEVSGGKTRLAKKIGSSPSSREMISEIINDPNIQAGTAGFMETNDLRSRLIKQVQEIRGVNQDDAAVGVGERLIQMLTEQMDKGARGLPKEARTMWREIRRDYKKGIEPFNSLLVRRLMNMDKMVAEKVTRTVMTPGTTTRELLNLKSIVGDKQFRDMSHIWLEQAVADATKDGVVRSSILNNKIKQMRKGGKFDVMFGGEEAKTLEGISEYLRITQSGAGSGTGRIWIQLAQAGAAGGLLSGAFYTDDKKLGATGIMVLTTPAIIAQLFTRRSTARLFIYGARLPRGSPQLAALAIRLTKEIKKIEKEERKKTLDKNRPTPGMINRALQGMGTGVQMGGGMVR